MTFETPITFETRDDDAAALDTVARETQIAEPAPPPVEPPADVVAAEDTAQEQGEADGKSRR
ncbi:hypothetical protein [Salinarimonas sp.]|uniref:hypothetical protein n=1 Tax=Salinarimonas sp. TaxID=2766526 RepID=UPI003919FFEE